jgi:hypothetical protein
MGFTDLMTDEFTWEGVYSGGGSPGLEEGAG